YRRASGRALRESHILECLRSAFRRGALAMLDRADGRLAALRQRVEQRLGREPVEVLVEIVVDLNDRCVDASAETFDLDQRELAVAGRLVHADAELFLARLHDLVRAAQPAWRRGADLQEMLPDRPQMKHGVERRDLVDAD